MRLFTVANFIAMVLCLVACSDSGSSITGTIGPAGGSIEGPDGIRLDIPEGALDRETEFAITRVSGTPDGFHPTGDVYRFGPSGTEFSEPVSVTLPYDAGLLVHQDSNVRVWWGESIEERWLPLEGTLDRSSGTVTGLTSHLSYGASGQPEDSALVICATDLDEDCSPVFDAEACKARGLLDIGHPFFDGQPTYRATILLQNDLDASHVALEQITIEYIWIEGLEVLERGTFDPLLALESEELFVGMAGVVPAADGSGSPGLLVTMARIISPEVGSLLLALGETHVSSVTLGVRIGISGKTLDTQEVESNQLVFPIELCWGCLEVVCCGETAPQYPACLPGQDDNSLLPCDCPPID